MTDVRLSMIVAMTPDRVIGRDGQLPWRLSADLRRFKRLTMGHCIIMGRKTHQSIGRPLPGRRTVVVSRQTQLALAGVEVVHSIPEAVQVCRHDSEVFFVGGEAVYREALPLVERIYRTLVRAQLCGDTYFPQLPQQDWQVISEQRHSADSSNQYDYAFQLLERCES
jgi:dihydrofolate reductase